MNLKSFYLYLKKSVNLNIFDETCVLCNVELVQENERVICNNCKKSLSYKNSNKCKVCGRYIEDGDICGNCMIKKPYFIKHSSYADYQGALKELILIYKYGEMEEVKYLLSDLYLELMKREFNFDFDYLIPVPMDKNRKRGFNHILEIVNLVSKKTGIKVLSGNLIKIKSTKPQVELDGNKRLKNLNNAFKVKNRQKIKGKKVLLFDDVYTTGTTILQCSKELKIAGADVFAITLSRA